MFSGQGRPRMCANMFVRGEQMSEGFSGGCTFSDARGRRVGSRPTSSQRLRPEIKERRQAPIARGGTPEPRGRGGKRLPLGGDWLEEAPAALAASAPGT